MKKNIIFIALLFCFAYGQSLKIIAKISPVDDVYLNYHLREEIANCFAIDTSYIYLEDAFSFFQDQTYKWKYKEKFSESNPEIILDFSGSDMLKSKDILVNIALDIYNLKIKRKKSVFGEDVETAQLSMQYNVRYTFSDSLIYYFWLAEPELKVRDAFKYNINKGKKYTLNLSNFINLIVSSDWDLVKIFVRNGKLFSLITAPYKNSNYHFSKLVIWNIERDVKIKELTFDKYLFEAKIIGMDKWENLYIISGTDDWDYELMIISPENNIIAKYKISDLVLISPIMKKNKYIIPEEGGDPLIVSAFNDDNQMFLMVKTIKGLYFARFDYLTLLQNYFESKTKEELRIYRNLIFAKHGRKFMDPDLNTYFSNKRWYKINNNYSDSLLSDFDKKCVSFIRGIEMEKLTETKIH